MYKIHPKTLFVGQKTKYLPSCQSTNDEASALIAHDGIRSNSPAEGLLIVTDHQTRGRGQRGNTWQAQAGQNLTFSLVLKPAFLVATDQFWLNIAVSLGIHDALQPLTGDRLRIKWPNDIFVDDRKLGGVLIENTLHGYHIAWSVVGIGLNVNQTEFEHPTATSLRQLTSSPADYDRSGLLEELCLSIEQRYLQLRSGQRDALKANYLQRLYRYQEAHLFNRGGQLFRGTIVGVDATGRLAIAEEDQVRYYDFKEVSFVMMNRSRTGGGAAFRPAEADEQ